MSTQNITKANLMLGPRLKVTFHADERGIIQIKLSPSTDHGIDWELIGINPPPSLKEMIKKWIDRYIQKQPSEVYLPIVLDGLPLYTSRVLSALRDVPIGSSLSYKELAKMTGKPDGARAVGNACGRNPCPLIIPCHRVLAADGKLGGFSCGLDIKKTLLAHEGISFS